MASRAWNDLLQSSVRGTILVGLSPHADEGFRGKTSLSGLTTHVLDLASGKPAAGVEVRLLRDGGVLLETRTNSDGRCDKPLLTGDEIQRGRYRLEFEVGAYYRASGAALPDPAFLDVVAIDFGVAEPASHYHVPLLVSPFGYSTYRGS
jgi:5-hydroxyisourate hydrolase